MLPVSVHSYPLFLRSVHCRLLLAAIPTPARTLHTPLSRVHTCGTVVARTPHIAHASAPDNHYTARNVGLVALQVQDTIVDSDLLLPNDPHRSP